MQTKLFEVRDKMTFIPVMVTKLMSNEAKEHKLLRRVGLGSKDSFQFLYTELSSGKSTLDTYEHRSRTNGTAHAYIEAHWNNLASGEVIDVEYILGETTTKKESEMT